MPKIVANIEKAIILGTAQNLELTALLEPIPTLELLAQLLVPTPRGKEPDLESESL